MYFLINVFPTDDYTLLLEYTHGHKVYWNMKDKLNQDQYACLNDLRLFKNLSKDRGNIYWPDAPGSPKLAIDEIIHTIIVGKDEERGWFSEERGTWNDDVKWDPDAPITDLEKDIFLNVFKQNPITGIAYQSLSIARRKLDYINSRFYCDVVPHLSDIPPKKAYVYMHCNYENYHYESSYLFGVEIW